MSWTEPNPFNFQYFSFWDFLECQNYYFFLQKRSLASRLMFGDHRNNPTVSAPPGLPAPAAGASVQKFPCRCPVHNIGPCTSHRGCSASSPSSQETHAASSIITPAHQGCPQGLHLLNRKLQFLVDLQSPLHKCSPRAAGSF